MTELTAPRDPVPGATSSAVASVDGPLVAHDAGDVGPEVLAAKAAVGPRPRQLDRAEVGMGEPREVTTRSESGPIVVCAVRNASPLVVLGDEVFDINRLHLHLHSRPAVSRLGELLAA
jgi:predicted regulator of Ras-like GTPase activity (Roadblock/LC7/MglB family)